MYIYHRDFRFQSLSTVPKEMSGRFEIFTGSFISIGRNQRHLLIIDANQNRAHLISFRN